MTITGDRVGDCDNTHTDDMIVDVFEAPLASFTLPSRASSGLPVTFDATMSRGGGGTSSSMHGTLEILLTVKEQPLNMFMLHPENIMQN